MSTGLNLGLEGFKKLKKMERDIIMYENILHIKKKVGDVKLIKLIGFLWLFILSVVVGLRKYLPI